MATMLDQLRTMTTVVADPGDMNSIHAYTPTDATTNPSLLEAAAKMPESQSILDDVLKTARRKAGASASDADVSAAALQDLGRCVRPARSLNAETSHRGPMIRCVVCNFTFFDRDLF